MLAQATYEYHTITIPSGSSATVIEAALTAEGANGWRLISTNIDPGSGDHYAHFEKKITILFDSNGKPSA